MSEVKKVLIIDARSYAAAVGNRARGGGVECQVTELWAEGLPLTWCPQFFYI